MSLPEFSVKQRVLVNLLFLGLIVAGGLIFRRTPMEIYPDLTFNESFIFTLYPGASPEEVEAMITRPIEDEISDVPHVDRIVSISRESRSFINVIFDEKVEDINASVNELRAEVAKVTGLPKDATEPRVLRARIGEHIPVVIVSLGADLDPNTLREVSDYLKTDLKQIPGVADVQVDGLLEREIRVEVEPDRLDRYHLSLMEIMHALAMRNINVPCGTVEAGNKEWLVRLVGEFSELSEIRNVVIRSSKDGSQIRICDVARVVDTFKDPMVITRMDGKPCVALRVTKKADANVIPVVAEVRRRTEAHLSSLPMEVKVVYRMDTAKQVLDRLTVLGNNGMIGMVLVSLSLAIFVGIRGAILAAVGIPFSFFCTMIFLDATQITINMVSVFALVLVLGMVVDDAIVVIENVYRHMEMGASSEEAAIRGTEEVMWPVFAAILTTIAAFVPLLMMSGPVGMFIRIIPKVVTFVLIASLLEAVVILPSHLADFGKTRKGRDHHPGEIILSWIRSKYVRALRACTHHRYVTVLCVIAAASVCADIGRNLDRMLFAEEEVDQIEIQFETAPGSSLESTDKIAAEMEKVIAKMPPGVIRASLVRVGLHLRMYERIQGSHLCQFDLELTPESQRDMTLEDTIREIRERAKGIPGIQSIRLYQPERGAPTGDPVELRIKGPDFGKLEKLSNEVATVVSSIRGVRDVSSSHEVGKQELRIKVDSKKAAMVGLDVVQIAMSIRTGLEGSTATSFRSGEEEIDVVVKFQMEQMEGLEILENMRLMTRSGKRVGLSEVAQWDLVPGISLIRRRDNERIVQITGDIDKRLNNVDSVNKELMERFQDFNLRNPGYSLEFGGDFEELERSFKDLYFSLGLAVMAIYLILGAQFKSFVQPLIILATVPFAFIGVILGLVVMKLLFTITAFIAIVALAGIVVNDSLILVDFINRLRASGLSDEESVIQAGLVRMRPILLTSITTVLGLLPLTMGWGGASKMWSPMAASLCWGLSFATLLTLFVIPSIQRIVDDIRGLFQRRNGS